MSVTDSPPSLFPVVHDLGAQINAQGVSYTVWSPEHSSVSVCVIGLKKEERILDLSRVESGYFRCLDPLGQAGDLYTFSVDGDQKIPDFASRFQPEGVFGPSQVIDSTTYSWNSPHWRRPTWGGHVIYELHVGTFTPEGTFRAAMEKLDYLCELGITTVELMPVAAWAGDRNWGYDGVMLFAPSHTYGTPDDLRALVDACHSHGLAIILDIVFNHLGPIGNHSQRFTKFYFHQEKNSPWGRNYDLDGPQSAPVRAFLLQNLKYWLNEFRFDGFRMDATHAVHDESSRHLLAEAAEVVHQADGFIIAEDERNLSSILTPPDHGGWGFDAVWADDFHHSILVSQTQDDEIYHDSYKGGAQELARLLTHGWLFQGEMFPFWKKARGTPCQNLPPASFIYYLSNHDQTGNRIFGEYLHQLISRERYRAVSLFFLLMPYTPMLFMGQEWGTNSSFFYFTDLPGDLGSKIRTYRKQELGHLYWKASKETLDAMPDPQEPRTFINSKLDWNEIEREDHRVLISLYREGLALRRNLFGNVNPSRKNWKVESTENSVSLLYSLKGKKVQVTLLLKSSPKMFDSHAKLLLSSNSSQFLTEELKDGVETMVLEITA